MEVAVNLDKVGGADKDFRQKIISTYWGGKIECEPHPKLQCGCDVLPNGWMEIDWKEFAKSRFFHYSPIATGWSRTKLGDAQMFFMHDQISYALIGDYWSGTVKVFRFGCQHNMDRENVGNCMNRYTCKTCGFSEVIDSSD
jgi:hypothetical protein